MQTIRERTNQNIRLVTQTLYNTMPPQMKLKLATLNVKGLNDRGKQTNTFTILKSQKLDIIFLQETNTSNKNVRNFLKNQWTYDSIWTTKTAILAGNNIIEFKDIDTLLEGRIITANFHIKDKTIQLRTSTLHLSLLIG